MLHVESVGQPLTDTLRVDAPRFEVVTNRDFEFFDSAGAAVHTNNNGEAEDVLRTRRPTGGTITVRAVAPGASGLIPSLPLNIEVL